MPDSANRPSHCGWVPRDAVPSSQVVDHTGAPLMGTLRERLAAKNKRDIEADRARDVTGGK